MSRQIVATATQIKKALKGSNLSKEDFLKRLTIQKVQDDSSDECRLPDQLGKEQLLNSIMREVRDLNGMYPSELKTKVLEIIEGYK